MLKRILTSLIGLIIFAAVIFSHHYVLYIAITLLVMGMLYEMYGMIDADKKLRLIGLCAAFFLCAGIILGKMLFGVYAAIMLFMLSMVFLHGKVKSGEVLSCAALTIYIAMSMLAVILIRKRCDQFSVLLPFVCAWLTDTGAYFTGTFIGKHKLVPQISPKKTVEGAIGGTLLSIIGCVLYIVILCISMADGLPRVSVMLKFASLGLVGAIVSQLGDLIASCIKRDCDKKDYGSILPGHGGLMDRFDSVIFVAPVVYYTMLHFIL